MLVCDLDGTLLNEYGKIDSASLDEIKLFCEKGGNFVICTGRLDQDIEYVEEQLGFKGEYRISQNGAVIKDKNGKIIFHEPISKNHLNKLNKIIFSTNLRTEVSDSQHRYFPSPRNPEEVAEFIDTSIVVKDLIEKVNTELEPTIYLTFGKKDDFKTIQHAIQLEFGDEITALQTSPSSLEVFSKKVSKGNAVSYIMKRTDVDSENLYVAGDAESDISMFDLTLNSFAVQKANETVKTAARHYVSTVGDLVKLYIFKEEDK